MSMLPLPAPDASALDWGICAASIPGWRFPWECAHDRDDVPESPHVGQSLIDGKWVLVEDMRSPTENHTPVPDPDDWSWEGWVRRMLGDTLAHISTGFGDGYVVCIIVYGDTIEGTGRTLGRACIAAAHALGRWPGGEG